MVVAYLGLGSNLGDREAYIRAGLAALNSLANVDVASVSGLYCSKAWGKRDQPDFLNLVARIETGLQPEPLLNECKRIERLAGRTAGERWGPRVLDIDILLYDNIEVNTPRLTVPHPRMWVRAFVLMPLAELLPNLVTPSGLPVRDLLNTPEIASQGVRPCDSIESRIADETR